MHQIVRGLIQPFLATVFIWYWLLKCYNIFKLNWKTSLFVSFLHEVACAFCAVAMSFVEAGFVLENATTYRLYGMLFLLPIFYFLMARVLKTEMSTVFDVFAIAIIIRLTLGRIDCIIDGCCQGVLVSFLNGVRWPIREIEIGYYIIFIVFFAQKITAGKTCGQVYPIYLITYGILRFILEWVREEYVGNVGIFHLSHIWSLVAIVIGAVIYYYIQKNVQPGGNRRTKAKSVDLAKGGNRK